MKYIVYQTTNLINNKIYIGVHKTENPDIFDGYLGCGVSLLKHYYADNPRTPFLYALKKYGFKNFKRTILQIYDTLEEALKLESEIVNEGFIKRNDTYNISLGGGYGKTLYPINQFDKNGNLITTWDNMNIAAETLGVSHTSINNAKLFKGSCLGYFFSTESSINVKEYSYHVGTLTYKYNLEGDIVAQFNSVTEAAHSVESKENAICRAINMQISHKNYYWSYKLVDKFIPKSIKLKGKKVYIYNLLGEFIRELNVGKELKEFFNINSYSNIKEAIMKNRPYKNYLVSLEKVDKMNKQEVYSGNKSKRVGRYSLDGDLLESYSSIKEATKLYGSGVYRVLNNRQEKTKGYIFRYLD